MAKSQNKPPNLATRLLLAFLRTDLAEEVLGDLEEKFYAVAEGRSLLRARLNYWYQVLNYLRPFALRKSTYKNYFFSTMIRHNLTISYRSFLRHKSSFFINLIGLSSGLACALFIFLWVNDELSINKFHANDSRLVQIMEHTEITEGIWTGPSTPDFLAEHMLADFPEIEAAIGVTPSKWFGNFTLKSDDKFQKAIGQYAGKEFFSIFSFPLMQGNAQDVLAEKNNIVISEQLAYKLFNTTENVIGKQLEVQLLGFKDPVIISGIFKDVTAQSTEQFDFVLTWDLWYELSERVGRAINWGNHGPNTYVLLRESATIEEFNQKIAGYIKSKNETSNVTLEAFPYSSLYLHGGFENGQQDGGRIVYVELFSIIAIFILVIACINFMNLSTAKASRRMKEVGVKKAIGASRKALIEQYLSESMLLTFLSMFVSMLIVLWGLPYFNTITGKHLALEFNFPLVGVLFAIMVITGLLAGSYPALYLSRLHPIVALKSSNIANSWGELWARRGLVVFQFSLSVILIVSVVVVYHQVGYLQSKNLGYDKENVIHFDKEGKVVENPGAFLAEVRNIPGVVAASSIQNILIGTNNTTASIKWEGKNPDDAVRFEVVTVDYGLIEAMGIEMAEGRSFSSTYGKEAEKLIFNEAAIAIMGMDDPIGKTVKMYVDDHQIIGVVRNFHFESLHEQVRPMVIRCQPNQTMKIVVKIAPGTELATIERLESLYNAFNPGYAFDFRFMDQDYQAQYLAEKRVSSLSGYFAGIAILISCLGLFGLASFTAERRTKEIGIRKILGSSQWHIIYLLTADFTKMVLAAIAVALPVSYFITTNWLQNFAYAIDLRWWYFAGAGVAALAIAWLTVSMQTIKASSVNPSECLRSE